MKKSDFLYLFFMVLICLSCKNEGGKSIFTPSRVDPPKVERKTTVDNGNLGRSSWQKPDIVIDKLGNIEGVTIADIGAGTGYFVFRLAYRKAKVIAIDIDKDMISFVESVKINLPRELQNNVETRLAVPTDPQLKLNEVDKVVIINTISYIENIQQYLATLKPGIKEDGSIMIVDFKNKLIDIPAPPLKDRISIGTLQTYLMNTGFKNINVDDSSLEYQYIITADK